MNQYAKIKQQNGEIVIHFILGMSRAGTAWMSRNLNLHPNIASFGETKFWGGNFIDPECNGEYSDSQLKRLAEIYSNMVIVPNGDSYGALKADTLHHWKEEIAESIIQLRNKSPNSVFNCICSFICEYESKSIAIEKTPHHINWADRIKNYYPGAKLIIMARDPYEFMLSYKYQGSQKTDNRRRLFEKIYHPLLASLVWKKYMKSINRVKSNYANDSILIWTNELKEQPECVLNEVIEFIHEEKYPSYYKIGKQHNSSFEKINKPELTSADYFWMNAISKSYIKKANISLSNKRIDIISVLTSIIILPIWGVRTLFIVRGTFKGGLVKYILSWFK